MASIALVNDGDDILASQQNDIANALNGPWTAFTPALTATTSNPTLGSGSIAYGRYKVQASGLVEGQGQISFGSSGTAAGSGNYLVSLPSAAKAPQSPQTSVIVGSGWLYDSSGDTSEPFILRYSTSTTALLIYSGSASTGAAHNAPWAWAANDAIYYQFAYEPA